jgi:two-component system, NarL family, sensor histidine kinase UhpB
MPDKKPIKVLMVEDNVGDFTLVSEYLEEVFASLQIFHQKTFAAAILAVQQGNYDAILLDLTLPDSTGEESVKQMIALANVTPVIVLTGLNDKQVGIESLKLGATDYLVKSEVNPPTLFKSLRYSIDRKKADEQLRKSEVKYRNLFHNNPEIIFIWDTNSLQLLDANVTAEKKYGVSRSQLLLQNLLQLAPEDYHRGSYDVIIEKLNEALRCNKDITWRQQNKNGTTMFVRFSLYAIDYEGQQATLALGTDVTEKMMLEKQLSDAQLEKQQAVTRAVIQAQENEREQLAIELHDNINQLLATSRLYIECAITNENLRQKLLEDSRNYIVDAIAELRKLSKTLLPPSLGEIGLKDALKDLVDGIRKVHDIEFETDWSNYAEDAADAKLKLSIFRIVQEKMNNILKHSRAKKVQLTLSKLHQEILLCVKDDGVGFDLEKHERGLGLQSIATRAEVHHGRMNLVSSPGNGSVLTIYFPCKK